MKDILKISNQTENLNFKAFLEAGLTHILTALAGFIASRAVVADKLLPFGLSLLAGSSAVYTPAAATGVFLGYFFPAIDGGGFRYIAAVFALLAIKLLLGGYKKISESPLFLSLMTLLASLLTSAAASAGLRISLLALVSEAALAAGGTYFVSRLSKAIKELSVGLNAEELTSLFAVTGIILTGINGFKVSGISLGHILGIALILAASKYGGTLSGAVCGTAVAFSVTLNDGMSQIAVIYAFIGLLSGVTASYGKYFQVAIPIAMSLISFTLSGDPLITSGAVIESALGAAAFLSLPRRAGIYLSRIFSVTPRLVGTDSLKKSLTMRLQIAAEALTDVSETVEQVSGELSKINSPDFSSVIASIEQDACVGCKLRVHCWESRRDSTVEAILAITKAVKEGNTNPETAAPDEFRGRCLRVTGLSNAAYRRYSDYTSRIAAENRIDEVRSVVSDQFEGISFMLEGLARDLEADSRFDNAAASAAASALKNLNIHTRECSAKIDKYGRMTLELKIEKTPELVINKLQVMKLISVVCERDFDVPSISLAGGYVFMSVTEHATYRVEVGIEQKCASESAMCGDNYKYFFDGRGHFIMVLSDGMGTGGRAAVDSAMASGLMSRLIKAGFGYDCSLKILNSSMLFKSTDESLATVDIASIDLYTGAVELYKAGAAPTVIRRNGRTGKAESRSLPAGILREIGFDKASVKCKEGDVIVLMSDGAVCNGTEWIRDEIENWRVGSAEELSARLCEGARRRRSDNHEDDITVITAIIKKAV